MGDLRTDLRSDVHVSLATIRLTQLLYRLGDSPTNAVTPMSAYIWMILATAQTKYMKDIKIGTLISNLLPIAVILEVIW